MNVIAAPRNLAGSGAKHSPDCFKHEQFEMPANSGAKHSQDCQKLR